MNFQLPSEQRSTMPMRHITGVQAKEVVLSHNGEFAYVKCSSNLSRCCDQILYAEPRKVHFTTLCITTCFHTSVDILCALYHRRYTCVEYTGTIIYFWRRFCDWPGSTSSNNQSGSDECHPLYSCQFVLPGQRGPGRPDTTSRRWPAGDPHGSNPGPGTQSGRRIKALWPPIDDRAGWSGRRFSRPDLLVAHLF